MPKPKWASRTVGESSQRLRLVLRFARVLGGREARATLKPGKNREPISVETHVPCHKSSHVLRDVSRTYRLRESARAYSPSFRDNEEEHSFCIRAFLLGGAFVGWHGLYTIDPTAPAVSRAIEFSLFAVWFFDGIHLKLGRFRENWRTPVLALLLGIALFAVWLCVLGWLESLLLGAILSPTDPMLASTVIRSPGVPCRLRQLLNVESGLNDRLALPLVIVMLAHVVGNALDYTGSLKTGKLVNWKLVPP